MMLMLPDRFRLRRAGPDDAEGIAEVHVSAWRDTYPTILPARILDGLSVPDRAARHRARLARPNNPVIDLVAVEDGGGVVGFAACGPRRSGPAGLPGEFHAIYLLRRVRGLGVGRMLMMGMAELLQDRGLWPAYVMVLRDNAPARRFYERLGGTFRGESPLTLEGVRLVEASYSWDYPPA